MLQKAAKKSCLYKSIDISFELFGIFNRMFSQSNIRTYRPGMEEKHHAYFFSQNLLILL